MDCTSHGVLYAQEYGWDEGFEALVAQIVANFVNNYNPAKERCWIAEMDGEVVGSVMVVRDGDTVARLRLLLVEPKVRGLRIGFRIFKKIPLRFFNESSGEVRKHFLINALFFNPFGFISALPGLFVYGRSFSPVALLLRLLIDP
jgi:predicted N-acetyltransferase YhbS